MSMLKKLAALTLALCLLLGCALAESSLPLTEEKQELTIWCLYNGQTDMSTIRGVVAMEELTGVHINYIPVQTMQIRDQLGILLSGASSGLPDIIYSGTEEYPGGVEVGIEDGVILDMEELIQQYMPNYLALLESNEDARRQATSDDGKMHILRNIMTNDTTVSPIGAQSGLVFRKDILDQMNLDVPTTIEGWHQVLLACKEAGMTAALSISREGGSDLSLAWGVASMGDETYWQVDQGVVKFGPYEEGYGEYLKTMRQWYEEELIDPNFTNGTMFMRFDFTNFNTNNTMLLSAMNGFAGSALLTDNHWTDVEGFYLQPIENPVLNEGDPALQCKIDDVAKEYVYITTACKNPELAAKWLDFNYTREGMLLNNYGIENESYIVNADGSIELTETILNGEMGPMMALQAYALNLAGSQFSLYDYAASYKLSGSGKSASEAATELWSAQKNIALTDQVQLTLEESDDYTFRFTSINTLVQEYTVKYILGTTDMSFADFQAQLKEYGIETCIAIKQAAYDRYMNR